MSEIQVNKIVPESGTDVTLGDSGDTFTVPSGGTIVNSGTATGFGGGKLGQVIRTTMNGIFTGTTADAFTDITDFNAAITPSATTSKILVIADLSFLSGVPSGWKVVRGTSTDLTDGIGDAAGSRVRTAAGSCYFDHLTSSQGWTKLILDEPSSTSELTYKVQYYLSASGSCYLNKNQASPDTDDDASYRAISSITLIEITA